MFELSASVSSTHDSCGRIDLQADCLAFSLPAQTEEPPSALSSPILDTPLDSPLSCADLTLDSTGEITVEDVRDFLT